MIARLEVRYRIVVAIALVVVVLPFVLDNPFHLRVATLVWIYGLAALGLNLLMGYAGQISLGHAGFFAIGAYCSAALTTADCSALRQQATATLMLLSEHASTEVPQALERALRRWDQAGDLDLLPPHLRAAALALQTRAQAALDGILAARQRDAARLTLLCAAAEASLAVDSACAVLRAVETRFASLLRAQLYRGEAQDEAAQREALLPAGQPFLDLGAALREVAWAFQAGEGSAVGEGAEPAAAAELPLEEAAA